MQQTSTIKKIGLIFKYAGIRLGRLLSRIANLIAEKLFYALFYVISHAAEFALGIAVFCIVGLCGSLEIDRISMQECNMGIFCCSLVIVAYASMWERLPEEMKHPDPDAEESYLLNRFLDKLGLLDFDDFDEDEEYDDDDFDEDEDAEYYESDDAPDDDDNDPYGM